MKALIVRLTSEALLPSEAPVAARAGRLMSMPEYGTAARKPSSSVKAKEFGRICMAVEMLSDFRGRGVAKEKNDFPSLANDDNGNRIAIGW